ncbi:DUF2188 domain-containing protein [Alkalicoccobacillus plakortidis]|uniref:DUF2188 domain-containing protein n=1 Tax=Alkalicoccobacillus plakortidis TaxID=444060 RepID=A0ABT0XED8_9BACI|nr:DUF2188 domain-containing protein [Alkalicoccobacillus plakortidis]MCM2674229.1 DUF2188 domain-containing protein [Alkalicoccobacillus plakortidis]
MKEFSVVANKDATTWMIKAEDVAPIHEFDKRDDAVEKAKELASENQPSKVEIFDAANELVEKQVFE